MSRYGVQPRELQLEDLALATACARGSEAAWEEFHQRYRRFLVDLAGDCDTADQIIAELYERQIAAYRGRSSLKGWLRAVAWQAKVDRRRRESRLTPLETLPVEPARTEHPENFERRDDAARLARALRAAIDRLEPGRRLLLSWYYCDQMRLAGIARLRGVHESTISRELDAVRKELRKRWSGGCAPKGSAPSASPSVSGTPPMLPWSWPRQRPAAPRRAATVRQPTPGKNRRLNRTRE